MSHLPPSPRSYVQIDLDERRQIDRMAQRNLPASEIAERLGRHRSTIYRELKRNRFIDPEWPDLNGYYATTANGIPRDRRKRLWKLVRDSELRDAVVDRLRALPSVDGRPSRLQVGFDTSGTVRVCATRRSIATPTARTAKHCSSTDTFRSTGGVVDHDGCEDAVVRKCLTALHFVIDRTS